MAVVVEGGEVHVELEGRRKWAGRAATGANVALQIYGAIETINGAVAEIEKAQTGSVAPQVAQAMATVEREYPLVREMWAKKFWGRHEDARYPEARDWLTKNGGQALLKKGNLLDTMGDYLEIIYWYNQGLRDLEFDCNRLQLELSPIVEEVKEGTRALYDASEEILKWIPRMPSDTAQLTLWGVYRTFYDAARDLSALESQISARTFEYKQAKDKAHAERMESGRWFNHWAPAYQKVLGQWILATHVTED